MVGRHRMSKHLHFRVFRDPVHGDLDFGYKRGSKQMLLIEKLIDTPMFQRLRRIRQNGVANLVFQGAEHSRFSHSMGVAWLASKMFDYASKNGETKTEPSDRLDTILASLLHDVGHGPFSHTLEDILRPSPGFDHEKMTKRVIDEPGSEIRGILEEYESGLSRRLLPFIDKDARAEARWYYDIVSSSLDADRLDYVARDALMAGVFTHSVDTHRLLASLIAFSEGESTVLVVDGRATDVLESFLLALEQMYQSVYLHRTIRSASFMLKSIIRRAADLAADEGRRNILFPRQGENEDLLWQLLSQGEEVPLATYEQLDESMFWAKLPTWKMADPILGHLIAGFLSRSFFKTIDLDPSDGRGSAGMHARAKVLADDFISGSADYLVHWDTANRVSYKRYKRGKKRQSPILVLQKDGKAAPIEDVSRNLKLPDDPYQAQRLILPAEIKSKIIQ